MHAVAAAGWRAVLEGTMVMDEITEERGTLVERVAAPDIGKASLTACLRVPREGKAGARRQEVRTFATLTRRCWNYGTG